MHPTRENFKTLSRVIKIIYFGSHQKNAETKFFIPGTSAFKPTESHVRVKLE